MPSVELNLLCEQIEQQDTDSFGKLYMYVSLLNTATVRDKSFVDGLPKYTPGQIFGRGNKLNFGQISTPFIEQVNLYSQQFANPQPNVSSVLYNIVMAYARKGKISDLVYLVDKILAHLTAIHGHQSHNQSIYQYIDFENKKGDLFEFVKKISELNHQILSMLDNGCNAGLSSLTAITGLVIILGATSSLVSLIGFGFLIGGAFAAFSYAEQVISLFNQLGSLVTQLKPVIAELVHKKDILSDKNKRSFFNSIVTPMLYAPFTGVEQIALDEVDQIKLKGARQQLDDTMNAIARMN